MQTKIKLYQEISRNDAEAPTLDPERHFIDPEKKLVFRMTEVGRYKVLNNTNFCKYIFSQLREII